MDLVQQLLDSWRRQCRCIDNLASLMTPELLRVKPSADGWDLAFHLTHIQGTRVYWLRMASELKYEELADFFDWEKGEFIREYDLEKIRTALKSSEEAVSAWLSENLNEEGAAGPYDHPLLYLQHMIWHEGWHAGLIMLGLRLAGHEPPEEWEDPNLWGQWRNYG
ncbi:MAG TPA: DinB family protein [Fimbriimonadaceae bacterium]|nr:DinB family protein [Fimbriimonadaceae bacterium]